MANPFKNLAQAQSRIDAAYVRPSHFLGKIKQCKIGARRNGDEFFVIELEVVEDLAPETYVAGPGGYGHAPGEVISHMMMAKHDSFLGNVKAFIKSVLAIPEDEITEDDALAVCAEDQPLENTVVEVVARETITRKDTPFTVVTYRGAVSSADLLQRWEDRPDLVERFFPNGLLQRMAEAEKQLA
jgi:hypothetical protein